jgi:hypothetical protein
MAGWNKWMGKKVFLRIKNKSHPYQGTVVEVTNELKPTIWITILDKFNKWITFSVDEIIEIKEEE